MHKDLVAYQQRTPFLARATNARLLAKHVAAFLHSKSPGYRERTRRLSPPLFARDRRVRKAESNLDEHFQGLLRSAEKFAKVTQPVKVEDIDPDMADANMTVVNGWTAFASSSQNTPSLSSGDSEIDELENGDSDLWRPSSPVGVPASVEIWQNAKMEEPLFPRTERPRGGKKIEVGREATEGQSFSAFMSTHLPPEAHPAVRILTTPKSDDDGIQRPRMRAPSLSVSLSMIGQPPSETELSSEPSSKSDVTSDAVGKDVRRLLSRNKEIVSDSITRVQDVIMGER